MDTGRSTTESAWVSDVQYRGIQAGLRIVGAWAAADRSPQVAFEEALHRESDPTEVVVGLATVSRLLAIELAVVTGSTEADVIRGIAHRARGMQHRPSG